MQSTKRIIIYDGDCGICTFMMQFAKKRICKDIAIYPFVSEPLANSYGEELYQYAQESVIFIQDNKILLRSEAIESILSELGMPYKLFSYPLRIKILAKLSDILYDVISRNRHKISKLFGMKACNIKHQSS